MTALISGHVELRPLREADLDGLFAAAAPEEIFTPFHPPLGNDRARFDRYVAKALAEEEAGTAQPFAVYRHGMPIGSTRLLDIDREHRKAQIGYTWYHPSAWRTEVNTACKVLLLDHAFGTLDLQRAYFFVDLRNERSQRAVARLGAQREGVLRHDRILHDGHRRDTVVFSILAHEWPALRTELISRSAVHSEGHGS